MGNLPSRELEDIDRYRDFITALAATNRAMWGLLPFNNELRGTRPVLHSTGFLSHPVNPVDDELGALAGWLQKRHLSSPEDSGHFILVLLFTAWLDYVEKVKKALEDEAKVLPPSIFIPGGSIRSNWEQVPLTVHVFSKYGRYINQPHMIVHKGLIMVYQDQSKSSKLLVLHRFNLSSDISQEQLCQQGRVKAGRVPPHEYVEEFYYRKLMAAGQQDTIPNELLRILEKNPPGEIVGQMLDFAANRPNMDPMKIANDFLQVEQLSCGFGNNTLTEMVHIREDLHVPNLPTYEGTLKDVSMLEIWKVVQKTMKNFPKKYNLIFANCIEFANATLAGLKDDLRMKKNKNDDFLKEFYR